MSGWPWWVWLIVLTSWAGSGMWWVLTDGRRRDAVGVWLANKVLWIATEEYRGFVRGSIEYGLRAAKRDHAAGADGPPDWRGSSGANPLPRVTKGGDG